MPVYAGWGEVPWGDGTWGLDLYYYEVTGVSGAGAVGSVSFQINETVTGVAGTGATAWAGAKLAETRSDDPAAPTV